MKGVQKMHKVLYTTLLFIHIPIPFSCVLETLEQGSSCTIKVWIETEMEHA